jgi:ATP synthase F1 gamma subunit
MYDIDILEKEIDSAKQLENITEAMQQAAALYLTKFRKTVLDSRQYVNQMWATYDVVRKCNKSSSVLKSGGSVIAITPNRGMYGSLVEKAVSTAVELSRERRLNVIIAGDKGRYEAEKSGKMRYSNFAYDDKFAQNSFLELAKKVVENETIVIVYPKFMAAFDQKIDYVEVGNISKKSPDIIKGKEEKPIIASKRYYFDPDIDKLARYFDSALLSLIIYKYFVEATLAYRGSQMIAMKRAHDNAKEVVETGQKRYFKIKRELVDSKLREIAAGRELWERN